METGLTDRPCGRLTSSKFLDDGRPSFNQSAFLQRLIFCDGEFLAGNTRDSPSDQHDIFAGFPRNITEKSVFPPKFVLF